MRQSCTSRCRGLTPLRGSSGKRERWASRSGERGCRGRGCLRGRGTLRGISSGLPSPPAPLGCFLGRGRGPVRALRSSPRAWTCGKAEGGGEDTHTHTHPPAPRIAGSPAASGPTWPGSGGARHPPAGRPDKAEGALPSRNGRGGGGGASRGPRGLPPAGGGGCRTALPEGHRPQPRRRVGAGGARRDEPAWPPEAPPPPLLPQLPAALPSPLGSPVSLRTPPKSCRCPPSLCPRRLPAPGPGPGPGRAGGGGARLEKGREGSSHWRTRTRCLLDDAPLQ